jgi:hypothetical protein
MITTVMITTVMITTVMITQVKVKQKGRPLEQKLKGSIAYMLELP